MKIACISNSNHNFFSLVRILRKLGYDAHLFLLNEPDHFLPHNDSFDFSYREYTHQLNWQRIGFYDENIKHQVRQDMDGFDFICASQWAPAFLSKAGIRLDLFVTVGVDLYSYPFPPKEEPLPRSIRVINKVNKILGRGPDDIPEGERPHSHQMNAIRYAKLAWTGSTKFYNILKDKIRFEGEILDVIFPLVVPEVYSPDTIAKRYHSSHWYDEVKGFTERFAISVFSHCRHIWVGQKQTDFKGNDKLIHGIAKAIADGRDIGLVLLEYGDHVQESKNLIKELQIESRVLWLPLSPRKELMVAMSLCDITCGEFEISWFVGGTIFEGLAMGKPMLHYREDELYKSRFDSLYPILPVSNADDVCRWLLKYAEAPEPIQKIGHDGLIWYNDIVKKAIEKLNEIFKGNT